MSHGVQLKEVEEFPARLKALFISLIALLGIGTLGFYFIDGKGFGNAFLRTFESLVFSFVDSPSLSERILEMFLALFGVFVVWWVMWSIADMVIDGSLKKYLKMRFYDIRMNSFNDHIIIAGGGRVGEEIAKTLSEKGEKFVIIEKEHSAVSNLRKKGYVVIEGMAENESILKDSGVEKAKKIILTLPKTETNILITLTVKELKPTIEVYSRCEEPSLVSKLKKAGAKLVVVPEVLAGDQIVKDLKL